MYTVTDVSLILDGLFSTALAEDWDNTGLLVGNRENEVSTLLTCLTLTEDVAEEAVDVGAGVVVSHHPVMFRKVQRITTDDPEGRTLLRLAAAGVSVYSPHTSFDSAAEGINAWIAGQLGLTDVRPLVPHEADESVGSGRVGMLPASESVESFVGRVGTVLSVDGMHVVSADGAVVRKVAVACGAAAGFLADAVRLGADTFLTGEARFHDALAARAAGISMILPGHYATERPAVEWLAGRLATALPGVDCRASQVESDPLRWVAE